MKRYLLLILAFLSSLIFYLQAYGQTNVLNQATTSSSSGSSVSSSSSGSIASSSSGSSCDIELSMTITNVSYPNGCNVGVVVTCCPLSQLGAGFITYGDSLGDDLNDLIISWTVDCTSKKVTFTGSGQSDCFAQATTICGNVSNKNGTPQTCNLSSNSVCCPGVLPSTSSSSSSGSLTTSGESQIIKDLNSIIENEKKAINDFNNVDEDLALKEVNAALSDLKSLRVNLFLDTLVHNARDEVKLRMKNNLSCAINHDNKAAKAIKVEIPMIDTAKIESKINDELKKAGDCKQKLLEDLQTLEKHQKK